jgi:hypothetical protein
VNHRCSTWRRIAPGAGSTANNAGTLVTQGRLFLAGSPLDVGVEDGFDILSFQQGDNTAIALLTAVCPTFAGQGLFAVPPGADATVRINVSLVGGLTTGFGLLTGLTVQPVPLPAPALLLLGGLAALGSAATPPPRLKPRSPELRPEHPGARLTGPPPPTPRVTRPLSGLPSSGRRGALAPRPRIHAGSYAKLRPT